jgi:hypothetical protein
MRPVDAAGGDAGSAAGWDNRLSPSPNAARRHIEVKRLAAAEIDHAALKPRIARGAGELFKGRFKDRVIVRALSLRH